MRLRQFLEAEVHKGDEINDEEGFLKPTKLKDLSKMLHSTRITLRAPPDLDEVDYDPTHNDEVAGWFDWDQYIQVDHIATTKDKAVAAAKKSAEALIKQGCKLMHSKYQIRSLEYERRLATHPLKFDIGPSWDDIKL